MNQELLDGIKQLDAQDKWEEYPIEPCDEFSESKLLFIPFFES